MKSGFIFGIFLLILSLQIVFAYNGYGYGWYSQPGLSQIFTNDWVQFGFVFLIMFGFLFFALSKTINQKGVVVVISIAIGLMASFALNTYYGQMIPAIILVLSVIFLLFIAFQFMGPIATIILLFLLWIFLHYSQPYSILPYDLLTYEVTQAYAFISGFWGFAILVVVAIILLSIKVRKSKFEEAFKSVIGAVKGQ